MTVELALRAVALAIIGSIAYGMGQAVYNGRAYSTDVLHFAGFVIFFAFTLVVATYFLSFLAAAAVSIVDGVIGAMVFPKFPKWQEGLSGRAGERRG